MLNPNYFIKRKQAVAYAIIAYYTLQNSANKDMSCEDLAKEMITIMKLYSPQSAEKKADKILKINN